MAQLSKTYSVASSGESTSDDASADTLCENVLTTGGCASPGGVHW